MGGDEESDDGADRSGGAGGVLQEDQTVTVMQVSLAAQFDIILVSMPDDDDPLPQMERKAKEFVADSYTTLVEVAKLFIWLLLNAGLEWAIELLEPKHFIHRLVFRTMQAVIGVYTIGSPVISIYRDLSVRWFQAQREIDEAKQQGRIAPDENEKEGR